MRIEQINCKVDIKSVDIGREMAIEIAATKFWEGADKTDLAKFQFMNTRLLMPFDGFHEATEAALGRPVWSHEFAFGALREELNGTRRKATFDDVLSVLPKGKTVLVIS